MATNERRTKETQDSFEPSVFEPIGPLEHDAEQLTGAPIGFWRDAWRRLRRNRTALVSAGVIILVIALAAIGPYLTTDSPSQLSLDRQYERPSLEGAWFGTDQFGRSMWDRVWEGTRVSLYIAFLATVLDLGIGMFYGAISGYFGGKVDNVMQRVVEVLVGVPNLVVMILVMLVLEPGILTITIALVITGWTSSARLIRGQVLRLKEQDFFLASRVLGAGVGRLILRHLIPNVLYIVVITLMFTVPSAIFFEAFLSFIGLGIAPPEASLGSLINTGAETMRYYPYLLIVPAVVLSLLTVGFRLLGDGLRDALDPRLRS
ncbi:ABC transporter permease [Tenggerimyces flavus]|uniref:ABC transporter permease n=1 Tax=Tenggerimyces flavus TaxID=1708749 RepID=A0ABV7YKZ3_9ACTN|nr:ABC transporter permease [Tenggerimyces flavus]MBM7790222.1 oligopeptide transport system permease protein [Tenggerimyces flavus]